MNSVADPGTSAFEAESDLPGALARLGSGHEVYEHLFPRLRSNAANLVSVAASLLTEQMRPEAALMFSGLRGVAHIMGARALERTAAEAQALMEQPPSQDDQAALMRISVALVRDCCGLDLALRSARLLSPDPLRQAREPARIRGAARPAGKTVAGPAGNRAVQKRPGEPRTKAGKRSRIPGLGATPGPV